MRNIMTPNPNKAFIDLNQQFINAVTIVKVKTCFPKVTPNSCLFKCIELH